MTDKLTTKQAAEILGVTAGRIRQMVVDGTLEAERFGQNLAISPESVELAKSRKTKPGPIPSPAPTELPVKAESKISEGKEPPPPQRPAKAIKSKKKKAKKGKRA